MSAWVRLGAKCIFIGTLGLPNEPGSEYIADPVKGAVYTINWMHPIGHQFCIGFEELHQNGAWDVRRFRPVSYPPQSLEHDIAKFKDVAAHIPAPTPESVE